MPCDLAWRLGPNVPVARGWESVSRGSVGIRPSPADQKVLGKCGSSAYRGEQYAQSCKGLYFVSSRPIEVDPFRYTLDRSQ
jgi:hypothetical protein